MTVLDDLGVPAIINAKGPATRLSGGPMAPEVAAAMAEAAQVCVDIAVLQARAGEAIAGHTGAEAGLVTSGAAAGLLLGTAACIARLDIGAMARLPDTAGLKNEVIIARSQRNFYDHAIRSAGAKLVEVGLPDRFAGAGVRDAEAWELEDAITERTAAIAHVAHPRSRPALDAVVAVARRHDVPVLVDAAAQLPPADNLKRFVADGADLVAFSGGKAVGGPQGAGVLAGRRELVMSAALQMLDMDIAWDQWTPPPSLIDKALLPGIPPHGIGRACKVGKETIVGLVKALELFTADDPERRRGRWIERLRRIEAKLGRQRVALRDGEVPCLAVTLGAEAPWAVTRMQNGVPSINVDPSEVDQGRIVINPMCLEDDQVDLLADRLRDLMPDPSVEE